MMIEWLTLFILVICVCGLIFLPVYAAAIIFVLSTLDGITIPIPGGDISIAHAGILIACPSLVFRFLLKKTQIDPRISSSILFIFIGATISSFLVFFAPGVINGYLKFISYLLVFYLLAFTRSENDRKVGFIAAIASIGISILVSCIFVLYSEKPNGIHLTGGFKDWNFYAVFLCAFIPAAWQLANSEQNEKKKQWLYILTAVLCVLVIGARSKSGVLLLALILMSLFATGLAPRRFLLWLIPVGLFGFIYVLSSGSMSERILSTLQQPRMQERLTNNRMALELFFQNPLVGIGVNQYEAYVYQFIENLTFTPVRTYSGFLVLLAECGIFAGLGYCSLILHSIKKVWKYGEHDLNKAFACSLFIIGVSTLLINSHDHLFTWCFVAWIIRLINDAPLKITKDAADAPCLNDDSNDTALP